MVPGLFHAVPSDWKLIFTGHSLGGALALLAATKADVYGILMALDGDLMGFHGDLMGCHRISWDCNGKFLSPLMILKTSYNKLSRGVERVFRII